MCFFILILIKGNDGYWTILETVPYTLSGNVSSENQSATSVNHNTQTDSDLLATATVVVEIPSDSIGMAPSTIKYTIPKADPPILNPKPIITATIPATTSGGARIQLVKKLPTVPKPIVVSPSQKKEPIEFVNHSSSVDVIEQCLASAQVLDATSNIELGTYEIQEQQSSSLKPQEIDPLAEPQFKFKSKLRQELEAIAAEKKRKREALAALLPTETKEEREQRRQIRRQAEMVRRGRVITTNCLNEHIVDFEDDNPDQQRTDEEKFMSIRQASIREPNGMYVCSTCGKSYKIKGSLRRHLNYECGVTPTLSCRYCPHKSKYKSDLRKHIVQKHANIDPDII